MNKDRVVNADRFPVVTNLPVHWIGNGAARRDNEDVPWRRHHFGRNAVVAQFLDVVVKGATQDSRADLAAFVAHL